MGAVAFLAGAFFVGDRLGSLIFPEEPGERRWGIWVKLAAAFGFGTLTVTWLVYFAAWGIHSQAGREDALLWANVLILGSVYLWMILYCLIRVLSKKPVVPVNKACRPILTDSIIFFLLIVLTAFLMFYIFHVKDGVLFSGFTVFSDYAPHTAMIRSFSHENNYPTQYPHFGGEDVRYHFMFQFLTGNLEYLGMRIDAAYNVVSTLALVFFLMLLLCLVRRLGGGGVGAVLALVFFFFRSGTAFFRFALEHWQAGDLWETLKTNTSFIGYTPNENWGLWNLNVYLNQRHLAFGLLIGTLTIWVCLDWLENSSEKNAAVRGRPVMSEFRRLFFSRDAWRCKNPEMAMFIGALLGLTAFWNGAAVIGVLLILAGFAVFSENKLDYFLLACAAVFMAVMQSKVFIFKDAVSPIFSFGYIVEDKTIGGVLLYLAQITGFYFIGMVVVIILCRKVEREMIVSFLLPVVFAFCFSLTTDINVNHKYIMISYAFMTVIWGLVIERALRLGWLCRIMSLVIIFCMTATGFYDFVVILKDNGPGHEIGVDLSSPLTEWLNENLDEKDLLLTPQYSINDVTLSGVMMYCGWPYYAWSAGYDTYYRAEKQQMMYSTYQVSTLKALCEEEHITYILYEDGMTVEGMECREDTIARAFPLAFDYGYIRIYKVG